MRLPTSTFVRAVLGVVHSNATVVVGKKNYNGKKLNVVCRTFLLNHAHTLALPSTDTTKKPGPGTHSPEKCNITFKSSPSHSLGIRHSEYTCPLIIEVTE